MLQIRGIVVIFCLQLQKGSENTKQTTRISKEEINKRLVLYSTIIWSKQKNWIRWQRKWKFENAAAVIKEYEHIIWTKKKGIISIAYHEGKVFKRCKDKEKFIKLVNVFKVHKSTIVFKTNIFKLIEKYPKLMKSSIGLGFSKNYCKDIIICEKNSKFKFE